MIGVSNFNLTLLADLIFLYENAGVEYNINDGRIVGVSYKGKDSPAEE